MGGLFGGGKTTRTSETRVANFQVNSATYGEVVPAIFGTTRVKGNVIDYFDFTAIPHTTSQKTGKGGGGSRVENTTYTYTVATAIGLCEGPVNGVGRIWKDKEIFVTPEAFKYAQEQQGRATNTGKQSFLGALLGSQTYGLTLFKGELRQQPWAYTQSKHPDKALPYSGLAYMAGVIDLGGNGGLPNLNFEVSALLTATGDGIDANPADCIDYIIFDAVNGVGFGDGGIDSAGLDRLRTFCKAADLLISSPPDDTKKAYEIINDICKATNTISFWSQNRLKLVPRCDERLERNGVVFEPNITPEYDLNEDDFLPMDDGRLVIWEREDGSEACNQATVEFINRANSYEVETVDYQILVDVNRRGLRPADTETIHYLHTKERAQYVASMLAMKSLYGRNKYKFRLDWSFSRLEPGDLLTLTERSNGLVKKPVVIETAEEISKGEWEYKASGKPPGIYSPGRYTVHQAERANTDYGIAPGENNEPYVFCPPPDELHGLTACIAVSGKTANWGGCGIWVSNGDVSYKRIGQTDGIPVYGYLTGSVTADSVSIKIKINDDQLLSSIEDVLIYLDGEVISYKKAELTAEKEYTLTGVKRGLQYTVAKVHSINTKLAKLDDSLFRYEFSSADIGKQIYIKLTPFNVYGISEQGVDEVAPYTILLDVIKPPDVETLLVEVTSNGSYRFSFSMPAKYPYIAGYLFRYNIGNSDFWDNAIPLNSDVVLSSPFETTAFKGGTFTVLIKSIDKWGIESNQPARAIIGLGDQIVNNVICKKDFKADGFTGEKVQCSLSDGLIVAKDSGDKMYTADDNNPIYTADNALFYTSNWLAMAYEDTFIPDANGELSFDIKTDGNAQIFYRERYPYQLYGADSDLMFPNDNLLIYKEGPYVPYGGKVLASGNSLYDVRVEIGDGTTQGIIKEFKAIVDVEDEYEVINDLKVTNTGINLPITKTYRQIKNVNITIQDTGGATALTFRLVNKDITGPFIALYDKNNIAVAGVIDAQIQGIRG